MSEPRAWKNCTQCGGVGTVTVCQGGIKDYTMPCPTCAAYWADRSDHISRAYQDGIRDERERLSQLSLGDALNELAVTGKNFRLRTDVTQETRRLRVALEAAEEYLAARLENPPRGTVGRTRVLPLIRDALHYTPLPVDKPRLDHCVDCVRYKGVTDKVTLYVTQS